MKKIHNNLNIENLVKTAWINQFDVAQKYVIKEGLKDNLDVNLYANPKYNWGQMRGFREVLKANLESEMKDE